MKAITDMRAENGQLIGFIDLLASIPERMYGKPMIEIGSYGGDSTIMFSFIFNPVISIDPYIHFSGQDQRMGIKDANVIKERFNSKVRKAAHRILQVNEKSRDALVTELFGISIVPFIYIDGCHNYAEVKNDIILSWNRLEDDGIIAGHDYKDKDLPGVKVAVNELFGCPDFVYDDKSWVVYKKEGRLK